MSTYSWGQIIIIIISYGCCSCRIIEDMIWFMDGSLSLIFFFITFDGHWWWGWCFKFSWEWQSKCLVCFCADWSIHKCCVFIRIFSFVLFLSFFYHFNCHLEKQSEKIKWTEKKDFISNFVFYCHHGKKKKKKRFHRFFSLVSIHVMANYHCHQSVHPSTHYLSSTVNIIII